MLVRLHSPNKGKNFPRTKKKIRGFVVPDIRIMVRVFANSRRRPGFNPRSSHTKDKKWYLMPACLNFGKIR